MSGSYSLSVYVRCFFTEHLLGELQATPNTVATYRETFRLLIQFAAKKKGIDHRGLRLEDINADLIKGFLESCKEERGNTARSCNNRLSAVRSFFRYVDENSEPWLQEHCREVLEIPSQRFERRATNNLNSEELRALIDAPDLSSWLGRRDRTLLFLIHQTGLRASELTRLRRRDVELGTGAHVRWTGKGGKRQVRLLNHDTRTALQGWLSEIKAASDDLIFANARGKTLSQDAIERLVRKHANRASEQCPTLAKKRVTPDMVRRASGRYSMNHGKSRFPTVHGLLESTDTRGSSDMASKHGTIANPPAVVGRRERLQSEEDPIEFLTGL